MISRKIVTIVFVFCVISSLASLLFLAYLYSIPSAINTVENSYNYNLRSKYNATVDLLPNIVYYNATELKITEDGNVFRRVVGNATLGFTFNFEGDQEADIKLNCSFLETLYTNNWRRELSQIPGKTLETRGTSIQIDVDNLPYINPDNMTQFITKMEDEIGAFRSIGSTLNITAVIEIEATTSLFTVKEVFTHTLSLIFVANPNAVGDIITFQGLNQIKTGQRASIKTTYNYQLIQQRDWVAIFACASLFGLVLSGWFFLKGRPKHVSVPSPSKMLEKLVGPYEEIIAEVTIESKEKLVTIPVKTIDDLVKIADILDKPVLHVIETPEKHIFSVVDGTTQYEFRTTLNLDEHKELAEGGADDRQ
jgi:hypothetical protein